MATGEKRKKANNLARSEIRLKKFKVDRPVRFRSHRYTKPRVGLMANVKSPISYIYEWGHAQGSRPVRFFDLTGPPSKILNLTGIPNLEWDL